jgi:hypothetical protein
VGQRRRNPKDAGQDPPSIPIGVNGDGYQQKEETNPMAIWSRPQPSLRGVRDRLALTYFLAVFGQVHDLRAGSTRLD